MSVIRNFNRLNDITTIQEVKIEMFEVLNIDIEVASDDEFVRGGGCVGKK